MRVGYEMVDSQLSASLAIFAMMSNCNKREWNNWFIRSRCQELSRIRSHVKTFQFFYFIKKTLSVNCFQKQYSKAPAKLRPKPGRRPDENYVKRCPKKRKLFYSSSLQGLLHISQSYFQDIFYLDLGFLCISYTRARKVMFRACFVDTVNILIWRRRILDSYWQRLIIRQLFHSRFLDMRWL